MHYLDGTMTFEQKWEAARYNWQYWVSYVGMLIAPLVGGMFVAIGFRRRPAARRVWHVVLALAFCLLTADMTMESIGRKWESRAAAARTDKEFETVAMLDSGNLAFAWIIGGLCGAASVLVWCSAAWVGGRIVRRSRPRLR
jgi:hypothetical protein